MRAHARHPFASSFANSCAAVLATSALILITAAPADAQVWKGKGRLRGKIVDPEGKPYEGANILLRMVEHPDAGPKMLTSDAKGRWSYLGLAGGQWSIRVETEEYLPAAGTLQVSDGGGPGPPITIELEAPAPEQIQNAAIVEVERGNELFAAEKYSEARAAYEVALETIADADKPAILRGVAQTHRFEKNNDKALEVLNAALEINPDDVETMKLLVSVLLAEGRNAEAEPYLARLPQEETLDVASRLNLGIELYNAGDLDAALTHFDQAIADFPDEPVGYYYRGLCLLGKEQNTDAIAAFQKFVEMAPDSPQATEAQQFIEYLGSQ